MLVYDWPPLQQDEHRIVASAGSEMADKEAFTVQGMTGVDLSLQIAGPGSRSYAFLIDWHIRALLAVSWLLGAMLLAGSGLRLPSSAGPWIITAFVAPPAIIYFFYHPILELLMRGQTPGKRMAGVRVVNREGGPPSVGAILIRNAFRLVDSMPTMYLVGLACTFFTRQRIRIGDMAAGTLLVMNDANANRPIDLLAVAGGAAGIDPAALDLIEQVLERWRDMEPERRGAIARSLLERIDSAPAQPHAGMSDAELRARLIALSANKDRI